MDVITKLQKLAYNTERAYGDWAEYNETAVNLEELRKPFLKQLEQQYVESNSDRKISVAETERAAYANRDYEAYIKGMTAARKQANKQLWEARRLKMEWEGVRSGVAYKRELVKQNIE